MAELAAGRAGSRVVLFNEPELVTAEV